MIKIFFIKMEYVTLGKSDLKVSRLCLGCMSFGDSKAGFAEWLLNQEQTDEMIKKALDLVIQLMVMVKAQVKFMSEIHLKNLLKTEKI